MNTILVWLLISLPGEGPGYYSNVPTTTVAEFATLDECERVRRTIMTQQNRHATQALMCIQAKVISK
jgi:hypothetical protein